jgi:protein-disulfide isomerase
LTQGAVAQDKKPEIEDIVIPERAEILAINDNDVVLGSKDATVTIVEYASMSCSHCGSFHSNVFHKLEEQYVKTGKVQFVLRDFPLDETALRASQIVRCSEKEDFYTFADAIFTAQSNWVGRQNYLEVLSNIARLGGLTSEAIEQCLADKDLEERILLSKIHAAKGLNVRSTPTLFINGQKYTGKSNFASLSQKIEALLSKAE